MKRLLTLFALGLILSTTAYADIARPKPEPTKPVEPKEVVHTSIEIVPDASTWKGVRLQLSESAVKELRDALSTGATSQTFMQRMTQSPRNTVMAGVLLFLSVSFAGFWLVRSPRSGNSRGNKLAVGALIGVATLGAAAIITEANAGPPPSHAWRNLTKNLNAGRPTSGGLVIEIVPGSVGAKLIIPVKAAVTGD